MDCDYENAPREAEELRWLADTASCTAQTQMAMAEAARYTTNMRAFFSTNMSQGGRPPLIPASSYLEIPCSGRTPIVQSTMRSTPPTKWPTGVEYGPSGMEQKFMRTDAFLISTRPRLADKYFVRPAC